ncbi:MAG: hypothetical protein L0H36_00885 [bacterium]|nr:hypothetical protein [bacterium]MDN5835172.1 hypothetical protein [bacterium]
MKIFSENKKNKPPVRRQRAGQPSGSNSSQFNRNRTLTGSSSSKVRSANELNSTIKSPRAKVHSLTKKRRKLGSMLTVVIICIAALLIILMQLTVEPVISSDDDLTSQQKQPYIESIQDYYASRPVERLNFLLNEDQFIAYLKTKHPEISSVTDIASAGFIHTNFTLDMRQPVASWTIAGRTEYVDGNGMAFQRSYFKQPKIEIVDKSGIELDNSVAVASDQFLGFVGQVIGYSKSFKLPVKRVVLPVGTTRQIEVELSGSKVLIKMSIDRSAYDQVEDAARAVKYLSKRDKTPVYIDVRIERKAYYLPK